MDGHEEDLDPWGGGGEEGDVSDLSFFLSLTSLAAQPDGTHGECIRRTVAKCIISSPNPAKLEMRI